MKQLFEAHITIEPVFDKRLDEFREICAPFGFKVANLLMKKDRAETEERSDKDSFCTGHSNNFDEILDKVLIITDELRRNNFKVWRYKIEQILLDKKFDR